MSKKAFAVIIKPLIDLHGEPKNWGAKIGIYFEALRDIPEDLLNTAVKHCIRATQFFPKPAELRAAIADELAHRHRVAEHNRREREMLLLAAPVREPPTAEDIAWVERMMAALPPRMRSRRRQVEPHLPPLRHISPSPLLPADDPRVLDYLAEMGLEQAEAAE